MYTFSVRRLCFTRAKLMNLTSHFTSSHVGHVVVKQTEDYVEMGIICKMLIRSFLKISQLIRELKWGYTRHLTAWWYKLVFFLSSLRGESRVKAYLLTYSMEQSPS